MVFCNMHSLKYYSMFINFKYHHITAKTNGIVLYANMHGTLSILILPTILIRYIKGKKRLKVTHRVIILFLGKTRYEKMYPKNILIKIIFLQE